MWNLLWQLLPLSVIPDPILLSKSKGKKKFLNVLETFYMISGTLQENTEQRRHLESKFPGTKLYEAKDPKFSNQLLSVERKHPQVIPILYLEMIITNVSKLLWFVLMDINPILKKC
jgi:hypothetical protein